MFLVVVVLNRTREVETPFAAFDDANVIRGANSRALPVEQERARGARGADMFGDYGLAVT